MYGAFSLFVRPTPDYPRFLASLKERIRSARFKAALSVNRELILLYWDLGRKVVAKQKGERWWSSVIDRLSRDLRAGFPEMRGLSASNIWRMRAFYHAWVERTETPPSHSPGSSGRFAMASQHRADREAILPR